MISPVRHPSAAPQAEPAAGNHPKPAAASSKNKTQPAQDTVTLSKKASDIDHDGDNQ